MPNRPAIKREKPMEPKIESIPEPMPPVDPSLEPSESQLEPESPVEPVPPDPIEPDQPLKPIFKVFVATMPDQFGRYSDCLSEVEKINCLLPLHPCYDFESEIGKKALEAIGADLPRYTDPWENVLRKDYFCIEHSDVVIFDLDSSNRGLDLNHFLAVAACFHRPIVAVSSTLISVPVYFSGSVVCVIKPNQVEKILRMAFEDTSFFKLPEVIAKTSGEIL